MNLSEENQALIERYNAILGELFDEKPEGIPEIDETEWKLDGYNLGQMVDNQLCGVFVDLI